MEAWMGPCHPLSRGPQKHFLVHWTDLLRKYLFLRYSPEIYLENFFVYEQSPIYLYLKKGKTVLD